MTARPDLRVVDPQAPHNTETDAVPDVLGVRRQVADLATQIAVQQHYLRQLSVALEQLYTALGAMVHNTQGGN
jgi:hypothetical protein